MSTSTQASDNSVQEYRELSKRVDATHGLILNLDSRFETHRERVDDRLERIMTGVVRIEANQARSDGIDEGVERRIATTERRSGRRLQSASNRIAVVSTLALLMSAAATLITLFHP